MAYGSAVPHLARSSLFRDDRSQKRQAPRPCPWQGCALLLSQACAATFGLSDLDAVSGLLPPLCSLRKGTPTRYHTFPIRWLLMRFRGLLACLFMPACACICAGVRRCAIGPCAESPRSARPQRLPGQQLSNPIPVDTPKRQWLRPTVTGFWRDLLELCGWMPLD